MLTSIGLCIDFGDLQGRSDLILFPSVVQYADLQGKQL